MSGCITGLDLVRYTFLGRKHNKYVEI